MAENIQLSNGLTASVATSEDIRDAASRLLARRYAAKGYGPAGLPKSASVSVAVARDGEVNGTLTIGFEENGRLLADDLFPEELARQRDRGRKLCEFTKMAVENHIDQKTTLGALIHVAMIVSCINKIDRVIIEVHPRHKTFYCKLLGFSLLAEGRINTRVNSPACLLAVDLCYMYEMIADARTGIHRRMLYSHFLPVEDSTRVYFAIRRGAEQIPQAAL